MTRYLSAYDAGYAAFLTGQPAHYNPYTHFTIEHTAWDKGYADAKTLNSPHSTDRQSDLLQIKRR